MDSVPNYAVELQRLRAQMAAQQATIERQLLENMELQDRVQRNDTNIEASRKALVELQNRYDDLDKAHGSKKAAP